MLEAAFLKVRFNRLDEGLGDTFYDYGGTEGRDAGQYRAQDRGGGGFRGGFRGFKALLLVRATGRRTFLHVIVSRAICLVGIVPVVMVYVGCVALSELVLTCYQNGQEHAQARLLILFFNFTVAVL